MESAPFNVDELPKQSLDDPKLPTLADYLEEYYGQMGSQGKGMDTYLDKLDKELDGMRGIVIIGGEPGSGKTALAMQIGFDTATNGRPVLIYSFEMPKYQLVTRLFQRAGKMTFKEMQKKHSDFNSQELTRFTSGISQVSRAADKITIRETKDFLTKNASGNREIKFSFSEQIDLIEKIKEEYGSPPLIIIDSLHEVPVEIKTTDLKQKIDHIMLNLRFVCDQTGATFILIAHQNRTGQKDGGLNSFLGSASIEYTVDMACTISIPSIEGKRDPKDDRRELIFYKNRYGTKPSALLKFDMQFMDFRYVGML